MRKIIFILWIFSNNTDKLLGQSMEISKDFGLAMESFTNQSSVYCKTNGLIYGVLRSSFGAGLFCFDSNSKSIIWHTKLDKGVGAFKVICYSNCIYVATYTPAVLYKFDLNGKELKRIVLPEDYIWDLCILNENIYIATYPNAALYRTDCELDGYTLLRQFVGYSYIRCLATLNGAIYIGLGAPAALYKYSPSNNTAFEIKSEFFNKESFIYSLVPDSNMVIIGMDPSEKMYYYEQIGGTINPILEDSSLNFINSKIIVGLRGKPFLLADSRRNYKFLLNDNFARYSVTVINRDTIKALTSNGYFLEASFDGERNEIKDMLSLFSQTFDFAVLPMSQIASYPYIFMGESRLKVLNVEDQTSYTIPVGVEVKAITKHGDKLFLATYPWARVFEYSLSNNSLSFLYETGLDQNRPMDILYNDKFKKLIVTTQPFYGKVGGAVTITELNNGKSKSLFDSIMFLTPTRLAQSYNYDSIIYIASDIHGGGGSKPYSQKSAVYKLNISNSTLSYIDSNVTNEINNIKSTKEGVLILNNNSLALYEESNWNLKYKVPFKYMRKSLVYLQNLNMALIHDKNNVYAFDLSSGIFTKIDNVFSDITRLFVDDLNGVIYMINGKNLIEVQFN